MAHILYCLTNTLFSDKILNLSYHLDSACSNFEMSKFCEICLLHKLFKFLLDINIKKNGTLEDTLNFEAFSRIVGGDNKAYRFFICLANKIEINNDELNMFSFNETVTKYFNFI